MFNTKVLADGWTCTFVFLNSLVYVASRCVTNITCIAQVTFKFVNKTLLVDKRWLSFSHFKIALNLLAEKYSRHGRVNFVTQIPKLVSNTMSAEDCSFNSIMTRTGSDDSKTAAGDEKGWSETFVVMKREIVEPYTYICKFIYLFLIFFVLTWQWPKIGRNVVFYPWFLLC